MSMSNPETVEMFKHHCTVCGLFWGHSRCTYLVSGPQEQACWVCSPLVTPAHIEKFVSFKETPDVVLTLEDREDSFLVWVNWTRAKHLSGEGPKRCQLAI